MNKGSIAGLLSIKALSQLLGCSRYLTKKELAKLPKEKLITLEDIGELIYEYRKKKNEPAEESLLNHFMYPIITRL